MNSRKLNRGKRSAKNYKQLVVSPNLLLSGLDSKIRVAGKFLYLNAQNTTPVQALVNPLLFGQRLADFANVYQEFRFIEIIATCNPGTTVGTGVSYVFAYFKAIPTSISTSTQTILYQAENSRLVGANVTVPQKMILGKTDLLGGPRSWYIINAPTGSELADANQGAFAYVSSSTSGNLYVEFSYIVEFRGPTNPLNL